MDFNPKNDFVHIPPDPPPDLGFRCFSNVSSGSETTGFNEFGFGGSMEMNSSSLLKMKGAAMGAKVCASAVEVNTAAESGIIRSVVLAESDVVCLGRVLGDNWRSRVLKEKIVFSNSDLRVSFSADTDLKGINAGCSVNLLIEGLGKRSCPVELFSGQYGSVLDVLANLAKQKGSDDKGMGCNSGNEFVMKELSSRYKLSQLDPNTNVFDINNVGSVELMDKRKKRSFRNEGLQVKASKVMWDSNSYIKLPMEGSSACKDEVLPDGGNAVEILDSLSKLGCKGMCRDRIARSNKRVGFNDNARMFSFSVAG
ncbi:hypothetical protein HanPI659440_Chr10g0388691 [Helianthus annuus]|nr:hypothetical protein HanPI659440_Chr10g0388691 [Helianthus annuus]